MSYKYQEMAASKQTPIVLHLLVYSVLCARALFIYLLLNDYITVEQLVLLLHLRHIISQSELPRPIKTKNWARSSEWS